MIAELRGKKINQRAVVNWLVVLILLALVISSKAQIQIYGSGDNKFQSFASAGTTSEASTNGALKLNAIVGQPMLVNGALLTQTQSGILSAAKNGILVKDKISPTIVANAAAAVLSKGASNSNIFRVTVTDNVNVASARISYKKLMAPLTSFTDAALARSNTSNAFSANVNDSWYDDMGLEYFYTATDNAGNSKRDPLTGTYVTFLKDPNALLPKARYSIGDQISNYRMISLPYIGNQGEDISSVFGKSSGMPDFSEFKDVWRLGTYDTPSKSFVEYPASLNTFNRGKGYWFILNREVDQISFGEKVSPPNTRASLFKIPLKTGWNMIGNPYPTQVRWSDVQQFEGNPAVGDLSGWDGGWFLVTDWAAFQGGYVNSTSDAGLTIPFSGQTKNGGRKSAVNLNPDISAADWQVDIHVHQAHAYNKLGRFGMINSLQVEDQFKSYNPPPIENSPEIDFNAERLCRSIVRTVKQHTWSFVVKGEKGKTAELRWSSGLGSGSEELFLLDNSSKAVTNMREVNSYKFELDSDHGFKILFGSSKSDLDVEDIIISPVYPNPTIDRKSFALLGLPVAVGLYEVEMSLFNASGSSVNVSKHQIGAGIQTIGWELSSEITPGLYYYRIRVSGGQFAKTQTGKLVLQ
jgi:hypothetical protein